jgi:hypothetical protein
MTMNGINDFKILQYMMIQPRRKSEQMIPTNLILFSKFFITIVIFVFMLIIIASWNQLRLSLSSSPVAPRPHRSFW